MYILLIKQNVYLYGYVLYADKLHVMWVIVEAYVFVDILNVNVIKKNCFDVLHIIKLEMWIYIY